MEEVKSLTVEEEADLPEVRAAHREYKNIQAKAALKKKNAVKSAEKFYRDRMDYVRDDRNKRITKARNDYIVAQKEARRNREEDIRAAEKEYGQTQQDAREARDNIINTAIGIRVVRIPRAEPKE